MGSMCVLLRGSSPGEQTNTQTYSQAKLIKKDRPSRGDGGQLSESVKSETVPKKNNRMGDLHMM